MITSKIERICKRIGDNYNSAESIENKLTYISILNTNLEFLVETGTIDRYDIKRDKYNNERIAEIVIYYNSSETVEIIID